MPTDLEGALAWRRALSSSGARLAFTNGCFDLLHAGHAELLAKGRECSDALIVGLNSDASVRRLKGKSRPLIPADERAELLAALEAVDRVVIFEEDTPRELILALRPDILVKGSDWPEDRIVGAREVVSWGGRLVRVPLRAGVSTSEIVRRVRQRTGP